MAVNLKLYYSFNQVFSSYEERYLGNSIIFEGCLKPRFANASNFSLIKFVSGGRRYVTYRLDRDGDYFNGSITYRPYEPEPVSENRGRRLNDDVVKKIKELKKEGLPQTKIADIVGVGRSSVHSVVNKKGAYAE